jgi:7-carboxy-7-deazaguanine synthase
MTVTTATTEARLSRSVLKVSEVFGPTLEGEGPTTGQLTWFLRMAHCNQWCSWCDTAYTWAYTERKAAQHRDGRQFDPDQEVHTLSVDEVCRRLLDLGLSQDGWLSISGGEPMLQQRGLAQLLPELRGLVPGLQVKVETAGTIPLDPTFATMVDAFVVSPKLEHSGNPKASRYRPDVLKEHLELGNADFKFVVQDLGDFEEIAEIQAEVGIPNRHIWIMPEGIDLATITDRLRALHAEILRRRYNACGRFHIQVFGDKRGT